MLNGKSQCLDLQEGRLTQQAVDVNTQRMSRQFGVEASTQTPKGVCVIGFDLELIGELCIHRLNHLADRIVKTLDRAWQLFC